MAAQRIYIVFLTISLVCPFIDMQAQDDASIKAAKATAAGAGLKQYAKFSSDEKHPWVHGGDVSLSFTSTSLTNWSGGGEDQIGIAPSANLYANYKKGKRTFENYGIFSYSLLKNGDRKAVKNNDNLSLISKIGHQLSPKWYYTASLLARTQFSPGYKYTGTDTIRISDFLAPISLFLSIGMDYRPNNTISTVFSPVMGKATFARSDDQQVLSNAGLMKKEQDENGADIMVPHKSRYEFGGGIVVNVKGNALKNKISYNSQLELFSNYVQQPENIDVTFWATMKFLIYKNISADLRFDLIYDDDKKTTDDDGTARGAKLQLKNYFGASLFYQF
ncbi:MAG: DUF3078 domain-containing protein [Bacteroidales bacterium]|jgi:hypothetical protein|nr:DUF3078 domain-containing protein [Bacteroidales bacterium]